LERAREKANTDDIGLDGVTSGVVARGGAGDGSDFSFMNIQSSGGVIHGSLRGGAGIIGGWGGLGVSGVRAVARPHTSDRWIFSKVHCIVIL